MSESAVALGVALLLALPAPAAAHQERLVLAAGSGRCTLRLEADDEARALRLRVVPGDFGCRIPREAVQRFLGEAFSRTVPPRLDGAYTSLFIGRLVDYPWLASQLATAAAADPRWDLRRGKPRSTGINAFVGELLSQREVIEPLASAIRPHGWRIRSVMVEKVLVGRFGDVPGYDGPPSPGKVPFDAMVWLGLERG